MPLAAVLLPLLATTSVGVVEYIRVIEARKIAQRTLDAAVLAAARPQSPRIPGYGEDFFNATLPEALRGMDGSTVDFNIDLENNTVTAEAQIKIKSPLLRSLGLTNETLEINSSAAYPGPIELEVALVFDVSGSMRETESGATRLDHAKKAANVLIDKLIEMPEAQENIHISVIPFSMSVALPTRVMGSAFQPVSIEGLPQPMPGGQSMFWASERDYQRRFSAVTPFAYPMDFFVDPANRAAKPATVLLPLTNDFQLLRDHIDGFRPDGGTAGHLGFAWAWYTLSPSFRRMWDYSPPKPREWDYEGAKKAIVLLTDGLFNTVTRSEVENEERGRHNNNNSNFEASEKIFEKLCKNARKRNALIFAVRYVGGDDAVLQRCTGDPGRTYAANNAKELAKAFENIAAQLRGVVRRID